MECRKIKSVQVSGYRQGEGVSVALKGKNWYHTFLWGRTLSYQH